MIIERQIILEFIEIDQKSKQIYKERSTPSKSDPRIHLEQIEQLPRSFGIGSETKSGPLKIWTRAILPLKHTQTRVHWR